MNTIPPAVFHRMTPQQRARLAATRRRQVEDARRQHQRTGIPGLVALIAATVNPDPPTEPVKKVTKRVYIDDVEHLLTFDTWTTHTLACRLGVTAGAITKACRTAGRTDLLDRMRRNEETAA